MAENVPKDSRFATGAGLAAWVLSLAASEASAQCSVTDSDPRDGAGAGRGLGWRAIPHQRNRS